MVALQNQLTGDSKSEQSLHASNEGLLVLLPYSWSAFYFSISDVAGLALTECCCCLIVSGTCEKCARDATVVSSRHASPASSHPILNWLCQCNSTEIPKEIFFQIKAEVMALPAKNNAPFTTVSVPFTIVTTTANTTTTTGDTA